MQKVLDTHANNLVATVADSYDSLAMPQDLDYDHKSLGEAALAAYVLPANSDSTTILARQFNLYTVLGLEGSLFSGTLEKSSRRRNAKIDQLNDLGLLRASITLLTKTRNQIGLILIASTVAKKI